LVFCFLSLFTLTWGSFEYPLVNPATKVIPFFGKEEGIEEIFSLIETLFINS